MTIQRVENVGGFVRRDRRPSTLPASGARLQREASLIGGRGAAAFSTAIRDQVTVECRGDGDGDRSRVNGRCARPLERRG